MRVAPFAGAWIEIFEYPHNQLLSPSLRSPERGLKFDITGVGYICLAVAPFAGAWIEIRTS